MKILKTAVLAVAMHATQASAAVVFEFKGAFTSGARSGQVVSGTLSFDPDQKVPYVSPVWDGRQYVGYSNGFEFTQVNGFERGPVHNVRVEKSGSGISYSFVTNNLTDGAGGFYQELDFRGPSDASTGFNLPSFARLASSTEMLLRRHDDFGGSEGTFTISAPTAAGAVPEPATWSMMIGGMGAIGGSLRTRRRKATRALA